MTQAFNLSQLANNTNSSGQINADTAIYNTVNIANGGTNLSATPANGQLAIGNGSGYSLANLTAGTGIGITNASGAITISTTAAGTVTSVATGNGLTGGTITSSGTISLDGYNGSTRTYASYPVGTVVIVANSQGSVNEAISVWSANNNSGAVSQNIFADLNQGSGSALLAGTWRRRGTLYYSCSSLGCLMTRTA